MKIIDVKNIAKEQVIKETVVCLQAGGLVIFPTETTYGAGVDATNQAAVDKLLRYKARREGKPLSIAVKDLAMAEKYVVLNDTARRLYNRFLPGPVTVVSQSLNQVAPGVNSEFGTLGVRIPDYQLILDIIYQFNRPITATSANASGAKRPYTVQDVFDNLSDKQKSLIDLVLDAGELPHNQPSTVIDTTLSTPVTLRDNTQQKSNLLVLTSKDENETKSLAGRLLLKHWDNIKASGLIIGLDGPLGIGKTIFAKGSAKFLNIEQNLVSPTYTYIEEYDWQRHNITGKLFHLDVWKINNELEFERLEFHKLIQPNSVIIIEWWSQIAGFPLVQQLIKNIPLIHVSMKEVGTARELSVNETK